MKHLIIIALAFMAIQLVSCGKSDEQIAKDRADSLLSVRSGVYESAKKLVRSELYVPSSARFPALASKDNDSLSIIIDKGNATVVSYVESQNRMGVYLRPDKFRAVLSKKDSTWIGSIDLPYWGGVGESATQTAPPPPPPPPPGH